MLFIPKSRRSVFRNLYCVMCGIVALICFNSLTTRAQIVNTEVKRFSAQKQGLSGNVDLGGSFTHNTVDILAINLKARMQYLKGKNIGLFLSDFSLLQAGGNQLGQFGFLHLRYTRDTKTFVMLEGFVQPMFNQVQALRFRLLSGAGARFKIIESDSLKLRLHGGILYMNEYEKLLDNTENIAHRMSSYLTFSWQTTNHVTIQHTSYYQPNLTAWADFRVSTETAIKFNISQRVGFGFNFYLFYDSRPPATIQRTFYTISNSLNVSF